VTFLLQIVRFMKRCSITALFCISLLIPTAPAIAGKKTAGLSLHTRMALHNAQKLMAQERFDKAAELLKSFREKHPSRGNTSLGDTDRMGLALVEFTLGNCLLMQELPQKAILFYESALERRSDFHEAWMNLAKCQYELNRHAAAGESFIRAYDTTPQAKPKLLYYGALSFMRAGRHEAARRSLEKLLSTHPEQVPLEWKENLVQIYLALKLEEKSLPLIEELAEKAKGDRQKRWQEILLYQYLSLNMKPKALAYLRWLTTTYPLEPQWWKAQVHLHLRDNHYRKALVALTVKELMFQPTDQELLLNGDLNLALDIPSQSVNYYERYLERNLDPEVLIKMVHSQMHLNQETQALEWIDRGLKHWSDSRLFMLRGHLLYQMERYRDAIAAFMAAAEAGNPTAGSAWLMAGYASWHADDLDSAEKALVNASNFKPVRAAAVKMLSEVRRVKQLK